MLKALRLSHIRPYCHRNATFLIPSSTVQGGCKVDLQQLCIDLLFPAVHRPIYSAVQGRWFLRYRLAATCITILVSCGACLSCPAAGQYLSILLSGQGHRAIKDNFPAAGNGPLHLVQAVLTTSKV